MLPLLRFAGDQKEHSLREAIDQLSEKFALTEVDTLNFSKEALDYASRIDSKIVLIDGEQLAQPMIDHGLGVSPLAVYEIKKIDSDYFTEE
jgi:restriction endonuclease Mrr